MGVMGQKRSYSMYTKNELILYRHRFYVRHPLTLKDLVALSFYKLEFDALQQFLYTALQHPHEDVFLYTLL
jgi:hypothetical protein